MIEERRSRMDVLKMPGLKPLLLLAALGVLLIIVGSLLRSSRPNSTDTVDRYPVGQSISSDAASSSSAGSGRLSDISSADRYRVDLETRATAILSRIDGAGTVTVQITLKGGTFREYAVNSTDEQRRVEENLSGSETRVTTETRGTRDMVLPADPASGRGQSPVLIHERFPAISGVLVAASGASDSKVKRELAQAAQTLLGVPAHRVMVVTAGPRETRR